MRLIIAAAVIVVIKSSHSLLESILLVVGSFFVCFSIHSADTPLTSEFAVPETEWEAYFTGPLLAPAGTVMPAGSFDIEPYVFFTVYNGMYDNHWRAHKTSNLYSLNPILYMNFGIADRVDSGIFIPVTKNWSQGQSSFGINDLNGFVGFQLVEADDKKWIPWVKLLVNVVAPVGKYRNLNPNKHLTDFMGLGSWGAGLEIVFYKLLHLQKQNFLSLNLSFTYTLFSHVHVKGFNAYGGGFCTDGRIKPGHFFSTIFSFEYSFNRYWAFAMDTLYFHNNKDTFRGCPGFTENGKMAPFQLASSEVLSIAPAIEYNFNQFLGIIGGVWFTIIGRNTSRFQSAVIAVNYLF